MKKTLSILLSICMLLGITAGLDFSAYALDESGQCGENVFWSFDSGTGELTISGTGDMYNYYEYDMEAYNTPFIRSTGIKSIVFDEGVTSVGDFAFYHCTGLISLKIPNSVTSIGTRAFSDCRSLTSLEIPSNVTSMGFCAFEYCSSLESAIVQGCVKMLDNGTFSDCSSLTTVYLPKSLRYIGTNVFSSCPLKDIYFSGTQTEWNGIYIDTGNKNLIFADIHYNSAPQCDEHSPAEAVIENEIAATCTAKGSYDEVVYCEVCGEELSREKKYTERAAHTPDEPVTEMVNAATCFAKGSYDSIVYCLVCNKELSRETVFTDKLAHTPETDEAVEPACTSAGLTEGSHCSVCGKVLTAQEVVKANGHSYEAIVTAPTCLSKGYTTYTCTVCGDSYKSDYVAASDEHEYKSAATLLPTCTAQGLRTYTCTVCSDKYVEAIDMLEHTPVTDKAVAATFKEAGKTEGSHCKICGAVLVAQKSVAKLGSPSISGLTALSKGFKATWKSVANIDGYQLRYSTSSSLSGAKTVTVSGYKSTGKSVTKLTAKKKYYVQIRAYKTINGKKQYSAWSKSKTITTKK